MPQDHHVGRFQERFQADILSDNRRMLSLLRRVTSIESVVTGQGVTEVRFRPLASVARMVAS